MGPSAHEYDHKIVDYLNKEIKDWQPKLSVEDFRLSSGDRK